MAQKHKSSDVKGMPKRSCKIYIRIGKNVCIGFSTIQNFRLHWGFWNSPVDKGGIYISPSVLLLSQLVKPAISITHACFLFLWLQPFLPIPEDPIKETLAEITQPCWGDHCKFRASRLHWYLNALGLYAISFPTSKEMGRWHAETLIFYNCRGTAHQVSLLNPVLHLQLSPPLPLVSSNSPPQLALSLHGKTC